MQSKNHLFLKSIQQIIGARSARLMQRILQHVEHILSEHDLFANSHIAEIVITLDLAKSQDIDLAMERFTKKAIAIQAAKGPQESISDFLVRDGVCPKSYMEIALFVQSTL